MLTEFTIDYDFNSDITASKKELPGTLLSGSCKEKQENGKLV
jgi:hypothetical protein